MHSEPAVVIVGGGISGLSTAFFLKQFGIRSTIIERSPRLGGLIQTHTIQNCLLEAGPDSYIAAKPAVTELAKELNGLDRDIIGSNDQQRRVYIVRDNRLLSMPHGMSMMVPGDMKAAFESPLFSSGTKIRFLKELFSPTRERESDISVHEFVTDHFGSEVLEYVTEPLLSGVYGGDSVRLSAESVLPRFVGYERKFGSLIRGVRREQRTSQRNNSLFLAFRNGMQTLTDALADAISGSVPVIHEPATALDPTPDGLRVTLGGARQIHASHAVLAIPAYAAAALLNDSAPALSRELAAIPYSSAILVTVVYRKSEAPIPEGFGFLVPRRERKTIAATTFIGTKWPTRIPEDLTALRAFIVDPESPRLLSTPDDDLLNLVRADYKRLLNIGAEPLFSTVERWPDSMPQYVIGHRARQQTIERLLEEFPRLHLTGNAYSGVGVPDCVRLAKETAKKVSAPHPNTPGKATVVS